MEQGGVESVVLNLNHALVQAGHDSVVISRGGKLVEQIESDGGLHLTLDLKSKNPLTYFARAWKLRRALNGLKPDLVCAHSRVPAWLFVWANRGLNLKWITYAHGANSVSRYSAVMTKGDAVVAPSQFLAEFLRENYGLETPRPRTARGTVYVIPNCVDLARFDPAAVDHDFIDEKRREWGLAEGEPVTMSIGRITKLKGFDAVIREFAGRGPGSAAAEDGSRYGGKLVIVGGADKDKGELLASLKALAAELGVADRVVFAGNQTKIPECLMLATEVVSGNVTKPESFGLSVIEAYAMNKPVRCLKRFGGTAEVMDAVAALGKPTLREAVAELYSFERFAKNTLALYEKVVL